MESISVVGDPISANLFGGNILANRGNIYGDGQYGDAIEGLNLTDLRYPGGSLTEYYFDISNPDQEVAIHSETGEVKSMIPLSEFMEFSGENGHSVTLVIPTRHYMSDEVDENGDRFAHVDGDELRQFINDVASGVYGSAEITAFEIGNEYWHSGDMNTVEYGRVAAEMANIIDDELTTLASEVPSAEHIDVIVQMGYNSGTSKMNTEETDLTPKDLVLSYEDKYDIDLDGDAFYSSGGVNYSNIANEIIINELESAGAIDAIDGVVAHVYSLGEDNTWSRVSELQNINETWLEQYPELEVYVTEWNLKGISGGLERDEDYGLFQAKEILNLVEEFVGHGVDFANVWPLIQNTSNAFNMGFSYDEPNAPGALFSLLAENLPGKSLLDLNPMNERKTEAEFEDMTVHGFADQEDLILYIAAGHDEGVLNTNLDIGELVLGFDSIEITVVGVEEGSLIGSNDSTAEIEIIDSTDAVADGFIDVPLDPHEIVQVIIRNYEPSDALAEAMQLDEFIVDEVEADEEDLDEVENFEFEDLPFVPINEGEMDQQFDETEDDILADDDGDGGLMWMLLILPLLALMGMG